MSAPTQRCEAVHPLLDPFCREQLDPTATESVRAHLHSCDACLEAFDELLVKLEPELPPVPPPPESLRRRWNRLPVRAQPPERLLGQGLWISSEELQPGGDLRTSLKRALGDIDEPIEFPEEAVERDGIVRCIELDEALNRASTTWSLHEDHAPRIDAEGTLTARYSVSEPERLPATSRWLVLCLFFGGHAPLLASTPISMSSDGIAVASFELRRFPVEEAIELDRHLDHSYRLVISSAPPTDPRQAPSSAP